MADSINVNFLYLVISIILLIAVYNMLKNTRAKTRNKKLLLETHKRIYEVPCDLCDIYLTNLQKNLKLLYKARDKLKCGDLKQYLEAADSELRNFLDYPYIKTGELDLLRHDIINRFDLMKDDAENDQVLANIILDIELILQNIRDGKCDDKKLSLIAVHGLMEQLYFNRCGETSRTYYDMMAEIDEQKEGFTGDNEELYDITGMDIVKSVWMPLVHTTTSQNIEVNELDDEEYANEKESLLYKTKKPAAGRKFNKKELVSQAFDCSSDYILTYKSSQPYTPFCDIDKLKAERKKKQVLTTDLTFNRSLRNDYDYLDA